MRIHAFAAARAPESRVSTPSETKRQGLEKKVDQLQAGRERLKKQAADAADAAGTDDFFRRLTGADGGAGEARESSSGWSALGAIVAGPLVGTQVGEPIGSAEPGEAKPDDVVHQQAGRPKLDDDSGERSPIRREFLNRTPLSFR